MFMIPFILRFSFVTLIHVQENWHVEYWLYVGSVPFDIQYQEKISLMDILLDQVFFNLFWFTAPCNTEKYSPLPG